VGRLIVSQLLTLHTTPTIYLYLDRLNRRLGSRRGRVAVAVQDIRRRVTGLPLPVARPSRIGGSDRLGAFDR
jgi:hypothetical protein